MSHTLPGYATRGQEFLRLLPERILVIDGAMGTMLQQANLSAKDFGGLDLEGCNENLVVTRPDIVRGVHEAYFDAGADVVATNTFGGMPTVLAEYGLQDRAIELNEAAARIAREAVAKFPGPRFVAGSMGPTTKTITVTGGITFDQLMASYRAQAIGLLKGGADLLLLETAQDTRNVKAAVIAIREAFLQTGLRVPLMSNLAFCSLLIERCGIQPILHVCGRDRNLLGQFSHLLGAHAIGIRNLVMPRPVWHAPGRRGPRRRWEPPHEWQSCHSIWSRLTGAVRNRYCQSGISMDRPLSGATVRRLERGGVVVPARCGYAQVRVGPRTAPG